MSMTHQSTVLIRFKKLKEDLGISRSTIWRWMRDQTFPQSIRIGKNSVAWDRNEVEAWIAEKSRGNKDA